MKQGGGTMRYVMMSPGLLFHHREAVGGKDLLRNLRSLENPNIFLIRIGKTTRI
jgi:hypothetical protein